VLVCHCHRVSDRTIRAACRAGARTREEVGQTCGAGTGCGGCRPMIDRLVAIEAEPGGTSLPVVCAPERGT
jgi:bacterioferritin-associated ferredoxin